MSDRSRLTQDSFEVTEEEISPEHLDSQLQRYQDHIVSLKRQQEQIERQKRELEELGRRQEQLQVGRSEMVEKFTRALVIIEREQFEAQKRSEMLQSVRLSFSEHLQFFEGLDLRGVEGPDLNRELTRALSALDDARTEFIRTLPRITVDSPEAAHAAADLGTHGAADSPQGFSDWLRNGFAFTLPLLVVGMLIFFALLLAPRR